MRSCLLSIRFAADCYTLPSVICWLEAYNFRPKDVILGTTFYEFTFTCPMAGYKKEEVRCLEGGNVHMVYGIFEDEWTFPTRIELTDEQREREFWKYKRNSKSKKLEDDNILIAYEDL